MIGNLITSIVLLGFSGYVIFESIHMPKLADTTYAGPGFFPICCAVFFIFAAVVILGKEVYKMITVKEDGQSYFQVEMQKGSDFFKMLRTRHSDVIRMIIIPIFMVLYGIGLRGIGFEIATFAFLVLSMLVCGERKPLRLILVPVISIALVYLLFVRFLRVSIPMRFL